jgi:hypothetical protein
MTGRIEIYHFERLIYVDRIRLWEVQEMPWEMQAQSRERQLNAKVTRLIKAMPFYNPDQTKIFVTFNSKMNGTQIPDLPEVQEWKGVHETQ